MWEYVQSEEVMITTPLTRDYKGKKWVRDEGWKTFWGGRYIGSILGIGEEEGKHGEGGAWELKEGKSGEA